MAIRALLIEDNPGDARLIREMLLEAGARADVGIVHADRLSAGLEMLGQREVDVMLLDLSLPDSSGLSTFEQAHAAAQRADCCAERNRRRGACCAGSARWRTGLSRRDR